MLRKKYFLITVIAFLLITIPSATHLLLQARAHAVIVQTVEHKINTAENYQSDTIRVEFEENIPLEEIQQLVGSKNLPPIFEGTYYERVRYIEVEEDEVFEKMVEYSKKDIVKSVDLNHIFTIESWNADGESRALPIDWDANKHWYYDKIKLPEAWKAQGCLDTNENCGGNSDVVVAVFDTGLALDNYTAYFDYNSTQYAPISFKVAPEMVGINLWENPTGKNANNGFCNDFHGVDIAIAIENGSSYGGNNPCNSDQFYKEGQPNDDYGHGTFVSGIIASATNNTANTSVAAAHNVSILTIKGNIPFTQNFTFQALEEGILYAAEYADVLNMSIGTGSYSSVLESAINHAVSQGVVMVAASGNDGEESVSYPAAHENAIAVGAINPDNSRTVYSNYGAELDFVAPVGQGNTAGNATWQETLSCIPNCDPEVPTHFTEYSHRYGAGTSYASPQVAAAAALIKSFNPTFSHHEVKEILIATVDDIGPEGKDSETGYGLLNLQNIYNSFYTLEYTAGEGGTIGGETSQNIFHGGDGTEVTAVPNTGYEFQAWSDGITTTSRTDTNVTADITVTANFEISQYTLTYTAGEGGTITGNTNQTVTHGANGSEVTAVAGTGYEFHEWSDGIATESRTDTNVIGDINVTALFVEQPTLYTLTYSHSAGGTVDGDTLQIVISGEDGQEVTAIPNEGYNFIQWSDGIKTPNRRDTNVTSNIFVEANFALLMYIDENFSEKTEGWGETHFSDIQSAIDSCTHNSGCKHTISQEQSLTLENSVPFTSKQIFEFTNGLQIIFPENVEITGDAPWDNILLLPRYLDSPSLNLDVKTRDIVKLGSQNTNLTLSQPIRLLIPGEAGEDIGYIKAQRTTFNEIENICSEDSEYSINNSNEECKINIGNDLVIWTNHLTEFITYEEAIEEENLETVDGEEENDDPSSLPQTGSNILATLSIASIFLIMLFRRETPKLQRLWERFFI